MENDLRRGPGAPIDAISGSMRMCKNYGWVLSHSFMVGVRIMRGDAYKDACTDRY